MAKIIRIEPTIPSIQKRKKVAAYARVSMQTERMMHSISSQVSYYNKLIQSNPDWEFVGVYADSFISGTNTVKRDEFLRMLKDCDEGKIDIILTKSISRFARNTVDLLETVRNLKKKGIEVRFEKEGINSLDGDGELMLTILASFAQEESRSISENVKWGTRKRFKEGIPNGKFRVYGYEWEGDHLVIVPEEAEVVRRIFQNFIDGKSRLETEREFAAEGITTRQGKRWTDSNLKQILTNITYTGNLLLQKEYVEDPISKKRRKNRGELPQYFVENTHEPIIDLETFNYIQEEMARRRELGPLANKSLNTTCFTGKIKCPHCHKSYVHASRKIRGEDFWCCGSKKVTGGKCPTSGNISNKKLIEVCCGVLGLDEFDDDIFLEKVDHIEVPKSYTLEFFMKDGTKEVREFVNTGHKDCWTKEYREKVSKQRLEKGTNAKGSTCFTSHVKCKTCGVNFRKCTQKSDREGKISYWRCPSRKQCQCIGLRDTWLRQLTSDVLQINEFDEGIFTEQIENIYVATPQTLEFHFRDGNVVSKEWNFQAPPVRWTEERKVKQIKAIKASFTPERRKLLSEKMKRQGGVGRNGKKGNNNPANN